jgi:NhaA family Na+:H+ antiporter
VTSFLIVPLFALANAGVRLETGALGTPGARGVVAGIALGLIAGKTIGISAAAWLAVRLGLGRLPAGTTWRQLVGTSAVAGIGFTVSLFVAGLAFGGTPLEQAAKVGILSASVIAAAVGICVLRTASPPAGGRAGVH